MMCSRMFALSSVCFSFALPQQASSQQTALLSNTTQAGQSVSSSGTEAPTLITLQDAIERARRNYSQYLATVTDAKFAHEDLVQARAALLPSVGYSQQYLGTQGNGKTPNGRYATNDGVHLYRVWGVLHQDFSPAFFTRSTYKRATASEALAQAKSEIARRGLTITVTRNYYALIVAQRKYASAQQAANQAQQFLTNTRNLETGGEVAHSDVVKAQLQFDQQKLVFQEAQLAIDTTHLTLAVLLSPNLDENYAAVDDLDHTSVLPPLAEIKDMAAHQNQDVRAALETVRQAEADVKTARGAFFPSLTVDVDYGIEANALALHSALAAAKDLGPLPNLGYFVTAALNFPVWNWGSTRSKFNQAVYRRQQARTDSSQVQREALSNLYNFYREAATARSENATLQEAVGLAAESLRLTNLRYGAGEATALEVVDAQNAAITARNASDDGQARYRVALANLETLTGPF